MDETNNNGQVIAEAPPDEAFPELESIDHEEIYNIIARFVKKAIPVKNAELTIMNGLANRTAQPKAPLVLLQILEEEELSTPQTRYTDTHKIISNISQIIVQIDFYGNKNVRASKMVKAFSVRFNDAWATEQFAQYGTVLFPLYSEKIKNRPLIEIEEQYADFYSLTAYFEYHSEVGICQKSAKELRMTMKPTV